MLSTNVSSGVRRFARRLLNSLRARRADVALDRELASHLRLLEDQYRARGLSEGEAHRAARLALGGVEQTKELHRDARAFRVLETLWRDAWYAVRILRRYPIATVVSVLSLAAGIGINAAVFSVVDWVLLRPLPYPAPQELLHVLTAGTSPVTPAAAVTYDEFVTFEKSGTFRAAVGFTTATRILSGPSIDPIHIVVARVGGDLFATLGIQPAIGRAPTTEERAAGAPVAVLGYNIWQQRFAADPSIVGRLLRIDGVAHTVVGVMPRRVGYPPEADLWRPLTAPEREDNDRELRVIGRLRNGATFTRATSEMAALEQHASKGTRTAWVDDVQRSGAQHVSVALKALLGAAMLTLAIACANVAALISARSAERTAEIAVRGALGATRTRVMGQLVTESLVFALAGGALGLLLGQWVLTALIGIAPVSIPRLSEIALDWRIVGVGFVATLLTGIGVALVPAVRLSRLTTASGANLVSWHSPTPIRKGRGILVLGQIAVAVVLTVGAVLLTRTLQHLVSYDHGFAADQLVAADLYLRGAFNGDTRQLFRDLVASTESIAGVRSVAVSMQPPTRVAGIRGAITVIGEGQLASPATLRPVTAGYFDTVGIRVLNGRQFTAADNERAAAVAIINETFIRDLLGGRSPIGMRITTPLMKNPITIVGVASDVTPAGAPDRPALYVTVDQLPIGGGLLIVRAAGDPRSIVPALASRLRATAPSVAADRVYRVAEQLEESRAMTRFSTQVAATFAGLALVLSMIGVYGITASDVSARWREMAVRLALGAPQRHVLLTVIRPGAAIVAGGALVGVAGAVAVGPALSSLLQGVGPTDPFTLTTTPLALVGVALVAIFLAASRVLRVDPAATLRSE